MTIDSADRSADAGTTSQPPGRLRLRRRLLLWSSPAVVLLLLLAFKLTSVGLLGSQLPGEFVARDAAGMRNTLEWIDVGRLSRGSHERLAAGDANMLDRDAPAALQDFESAHQEDPAACPPRGNYAMTGELLSDRELAAGKFINARTLLEQVVQVADGDTACFATTPATDPTIKAFVTQTPERLHDKLDALKAGAITHTPDGYDYLRAPGGDILALQAGEPEPCPFDRSDEAALRACVESRDTERDQQLQQAQQQKAGEPQPPPALDARPAPPSPDAASEPGVQFPRGMTPMVPDPNGEWTLVPFCDGNGTPLGELGALLCTTSGPLP